MSIKIADIIICDDIRQETNGKFILIGAYPTGISVAQLPTVIPLSIWAVFECKDEEKFVIEMEVRSPQSNHKIALKAGFERHSNEAIRAPIAISQMPFQLDNTGDAEIYFREEGQEEWTLIKTFPIEAKSATTEVSINNDKTS